MSEEIFINFTPQETRVAVIDQGSVQELHIERTASRGLVGNIYLGKVVRVLPGMQSAFDIFKVTTTTTYYSTECLSLFCYL